MIQAALASALLFAGYRSVAVLGGHLSQTVRSFSPTTYNVAAGVKGKEQVPTGCGCAVWRDTDD